MKLTRLQARRFLLAYQGLLPAHSLQGKAGVMEYLRRVGSIQFDPLNTAGRSPELVLQARVADFRPAMLNGLLYEERRLLDGWDKMMSIYAVEDRPYFARRRAADRLHLEKNAPEVMRVLPEVRRAIEERGPLSSLDLELNQTVDWAWAPTRLARAALESMYTWGELIIHHKVHTRKVYDFAHRHLPAELLAAPEPNPGEAQYQDWYVLRRIGAVGLIWKRNGDAWLGMNGIQIAERSAAVERLLADGRICAVEAEGFSEPLYLRSTELPLLEEILQEPNGHAPHAALLAPLDNLLWDRRYLEALFGFSYRWEVYKPAAERQYGYYVLPVLYGERFAARFEPLREKQSGALIIRGWWWEEGITPDREMRAELQRCLERFCAFLGTSQMRFEPEAARQFGS